MPNDQEFDNSPEEEQENEESKPQKGLVERGKEASKDIKTLSKAGAQAAIGNWLGAAREALKSPLFTKILTWVLYIIAGFCLLGTIVLFEACVPGLNCYYGRCPTESVDVVEDHRLIEQVLALSGNEQQRKQLILEEAEDLLKRFKEIKSSFDPNTQSKIDIIITKLNELIALKAEKKPTQKKVDEIYELYLDIENALIEKTRGLLVDDNWQVIRIGKISTTKKCSVCPGGRCNKYYIVRPKDKLLAEQIRRTAIQSVGLKHKDIDPGNNAQCKALIYLVLNRVAGTGSTGSGAHPDNPYIQTEGWPSPTYFEEIPPQPTPVKPEPGDLIWFDYGYSPNCTGNPHWAIAV